MTPDEKLKIQNELEKRVLQAKEAIKSLKEQTKPIAPDVSLGRLTRMDAIQAKSVKEANLRSAQETLINLEESLKKIDDPEFGICLRCKKAIPLERLLALPEATNCVNCSGRIW